MCVVCISTEHHAASCIPRLSCRSRLPPPALLATLGRRWIWATAAAVRPSDRRMESVQTRSRRERQAVEQEAGSSLFHCLLPLHTQETSEESRKAGPYPHRCHHHHHQDETHERDERDCVNSIRREQQNSPVQREATSSSFSRLMPNSLSLPF